MSYVSPSFWLGMDPDKVAKMTLDEFRVTQQSVNEQRNDIYTIVKMGVRDGIIEAMDAVGLLKKKGGGPNG